MAGFQDIFAPPQGQSFFDGPPPTVPDASEVQGGASNRDIFGGAMNVGSLLIPGLGAVSSAYNMGNGAVQGFDKGQYGNINTAYQMGGGDSPDFAAPQPSQHDSVFGSQRAGDALYGGGISGWLGNVLGQIAGGISSLGDGTIDAPQDSVPQPNYTPMGQPEASSLMQSIMDSLNLPDSGQQQVMATSRPPNFLPIAPPSPATPTLPAFAPGVAESLAGYGSGPLNPSNPLGHDPAAAAANQNPSSYGSLASLFSGGDGNYQSSYPNPASFNLTGNMLSTFMQGAGFGAGRYDSNNDPLLQGGTFAPGFGAVDRAANPFDTN